MRLFDKDGEPLYKDVKGNVEEGQSIMPFFPGYTFDFGKSIFMDEAVGEGGYVYSEPGMYTDVALLDITSMHPSSIIAEDLFGVFFTKRFKDIVDARIAIKNGDLEKAKTIFDGKLKPYLENEDRIDDLSYALKIAVNSVYGLTSASFSNPFKDPRNKDNIVAKRGALFMVKLKHAVQKMGYQVAHIKTDSIKIPNSDDKIIDYIYKYGKEFGYEFKHEATYDRFCLVNDAVYIARYKDGKHKGEWTATGTQFQVPYVFKTLFSKEPIIFEDLCETKNVSTSIYLNFNEGKEDDNYDDLKFVGRIGLFCPVIEGAGGGLLLRQTINKKDNSIGYSFVTGTKGYRWMESEVIKNLGIENLINKEYYNKLVDEAVKDISSYGDFEWFIGE